MNDDHVREVGLQIGERVLGQGGRTRGEELAGVMLAFLTFARACGMSDDEIRAALDAGKSMVGTLAPNSSTTALALAPQHHTPTGLHP